MKIKSVLVCSVEWGWLQSGRGDLSGLMETVCFEWDSGERGVYICQNSTIHLKCVHVIVCKLYLNKVDKKKNKQKQKDGTMELYKSVINCQMTTYFSSDWEVKYYIPCIWVHHVTCFAQWNISHMWHNRRLWSLPVCCSWNPETIMWISPS